MTPKETGEELPGRHLSFQYEAALLDDVLVLLPTRSLAVDVAPDYVFQALGVRARA